jgi:hypothetical protein
MLATFVLSFRLTYQTVANSTLVPRHLLALTGQLLPSFASRRQLGLFNHKIRKPVAHGELQTTTSAKQVSLFIGEACLPRWIEWTPQDFQEFRTNHVRHLFENRFGARRCAPAAIIWRGLALSKDEGRKTARDVVAHAEPRRHCVL